MGLLINVFTMKPDDSSSFSGIDCTNGGMSSKATTLLVENVEGPFEPEDYSEYPVVVLETGPYDTARIVLKEFVDAKKWYMFGGNYAGTSDSRFNKAVEEITGAKGIDIVKIFDRIE